MKDLNDLINKIRGTIISSIPSDREWETATFYTIILITYSQSAGKTIDKNGTEKSLSIKFEPTHPNFVWQLREAMYNYAPDKGAWYRVDMTVKREGKAELNFDYENEPAFNIHIDDIDFIKDNEKFPRADELKPEWLKNILTRSNQSE